MKIGFYLGELFSSDGGVYTLESEIFDALLNYKGEHDLFIFTARNEVAKQSLSHKIIKLPNDSAPSFYSKVRGKLKTLLYKSSPNTSLLDSGNETLLGKLAKENNLDLIWFFNGFKYVDIPYVMSVQDLQHRKQPYFPEVNTYGWKWNQRELLYYSSVRRASYVVSGSNEGKKDIEFFYQVPEERIHVIQLPAPQDTLDCFNQEIPLPAGLNINKPYIFYPAQFWSHKNHISLLLALKKLEERAPGKYTLVLSGADKGNLTYINEKISELGLAPSVRHLGVVDRKTILALYKNALALVFPTLFGPDNLPPLEAFAAGCPVIAGDLPGSQEYFGSGALFVDPTSEDQIANAIEKLASDSSFRDTLITQGRKRAIMHTPKTYVEEIFKVVDKFALIKRCWGKMI